MNMDLIAGCYVLLAMCMSAFAQQNPPCSNETEEEEIMGAWNRQSRFGKQSVLLLVAIGAGSLLGQSLPALAAAPMPARMW
jgi:hypothetical protein